MVVSGHSCREPSVCEVEGGKGVRRDIEEWS